MANEELVNVFITDDELKDAAMLVPAHDRVYKAMSGLKTFIIAEFFKHGWIVEDPDALYKPKRRRLKIPGTKRVEECWFVQIPKAACKRV